MDRRSAASSRSGLMFSGYRGPKGVLERRRESKQILLVALIAVSGGEEGELVHDADDAPVAHIALRAGVAFDDGRGVVGSEPADLRLGSGCLQNCHNWSF